MNAREEKGLLDAAIARSEKAETEVDRLQALHLACVSELIAVAQAAKRRCLMGGGGGAGGDLLNASHALDVKLAELEPRQGTENGPEEWDDVLVAEGFGVLEGDDG